MACKHIHPTHCQTFVKSTIGSKTPQEIAQGETAKVESPLYQGVMQSLRKTMQQKAPLASDPRSDQAAAWRARH